MRRNVVPPQAYFVVSAIFHYLGPAFAVLLFARIDPLGVAWLRIAAAGTIFWLWRRPFRAWRSLDSSTRRLLVGWGVVLAVMNCSFYLAIDRVPLGTVAATEFAPIIVLAAIAVRSLRNLLALVLAVVGVYILTDVRLSHDRIGLICTALNALLFAAYVVLGHRVSRVDELRRIDGLALAMGIATVIALPVGVLQAKPAFTNPTLLAAAVGVGICSSVIPYVADQLAMARLKRSTFALMLALLPATATLIGALVLHQFPTLPELAAVTTIVTAVALHHEPA
ncbi:EamA family transporter [Kribbella sp. NPDC051952]|uniref:EamA family transporter n=1 Tax=Kribbella sp. NPDC051952 TaxID=3154851 RepID=UPI00343BCBD6